jgi:hypothetical protein
VTLQAQERNLGAADESPRLELDLNETEFVEYAYANGLTDGLPVVAPTQERVQAMLKGANLEAGLLIGTVPPRQGTLTAEVVAANAVMAGCLPVHMPVVLAAIEAMLDPVFNLRTVQMTTSPVGPLILVNGPFGRQAGVHPGQGCMGPGFRANMTIGRAIRLILVNAGGATLGEIDFATHGFPGKLSFCFAENESESPFPPLHVDRGYGAEKSVVHVHHAQGTFNIVDSPSSNAVEVLTTIAQSMRGVGSNNMQLPHGEVLVVLSPKHAKIIADNGFDKAHIQRFLYLNSSVTASEFHPAMRQHLTVFRRDEFPIIFDSTRVPLVSKPEDIAVVVAGGVGPHTVFVPGLADTLMVHREIKVP